MTGHEGAARGRIVVVNARTDEVLFSKAPHEVQFHGPLHFVPVSLWITDCTFPEEGIYYVQVHFDDKLIGERSPSSGSRRGDRQQWTAPRINPAVLLPPNFFRGPAIPPRRVRR